jgi:class 3 adenylate cyclase
VAERTLTSVRLYERGAPRVARGIYDLEPTADGKTVLTAYFGFIPRGLWQRWLLRIALGQILAGYERVLPSIVASLRDATPSPYIAPPPPLPPEAHARAAALCEEIVEQGVPKEAAQRLLTLVQTGDPMDLARIRALPLARCWELDESDVLSAFLHATRAGLLALSWDVVCPHCRGVRAEVSTLGEVPRRGSCEVCAIDFDTDSDNAIEVAFHVHPSIREVPELFFCSAEPSRRSHIKVQQRVEAGEAITVETALAPGRYRMRTAGTERYRLLDVSKGGSNQELTWSADVVPEEPAQSAPNPTLTLKAPTPAPSTFIIEDAHWSDDALRPARLFSSQEFRDLFTEEYVGSDVQLSVGQQTILFTDVVGSTALYAERGDPAAFVDVKRHFTEIFDEVRRHRGAVVKTIGDAAMAAFVDPVDALRTALGIQRRLMSQRDTLGIRVRASLNTGPCIAVRLNTNIDYFGSTVNAAAKLQACAGAGEVAFVESLTDYPGVAELLREEGAELEPVEFASPALGGSVRALRWRI